MMSISILRVLLATCLAIALLITLRSNILNEAPRSIIHKPDLEAIIKAGPGQVITPEKPYRFARRNMVTFSVNGCDKPIYVLPGALHNEAYQYLIAGDHIQLSQYEKAMSYIGDVRSPVAVFKLYLEKLNFDIRHFFGAKKIKHGSYGLFFLVPRGCDLHGKFEWQKLWLNGG
jgi:hypothetical protein